MEIVVLLIEQTTEYRRKIVKMNIKIQCVSKYYSL